MEVDNVSHVDQLMGLLEKQKVALQAASKRKGERPKNRKPRGQLIQEFMLQSLGANMMRKNKDQQMMRQSWVANPYPPSVAPFRGLKKLYIKDLLLETHHRDYYILLRVSTPPRTLTAVMVIAEDEKDDGLLLQLYQQECDGRGPVNEAIQIQRVCIVKEPYFKIVNDGGYGLRVDHLSDVIWLSPDDERIPLCWRTRISEIEKTAETLKEEGNLALKMGNLNLAVQSYTSAIRGSTTFEMVKILKLNRSLANLKLGYYDSALEDAGEFTADAQRAEKGFYRAALALYELERFQGSHQVLESLISLYPHCDAAQKEINRTKQRLREQEHGNYDFRAMYKAAEDIPPCLDNATFTGNVEVRPSKGRGRGLFTTKDVVAGELLLCEKAFSYCSAKHSGTSVLINIHTNSMTQGTQADLITATVQKMFKNPSLRPGFASLYHGDYTPVDETEIDSIPVIDTFFVERVISLNVFGCPRTSLEYHSADLTSKRQDQSRSHHTCGIFIKASHINHSCYSNVRRSFIGDMQIVRATRNIPADSEIVFCYTAPGPNDTYEKTQKKLQTWGFQCTCAICQQMKETKKTVSSRRLALLGDLEAAFSDQRGANLPKTERILDAIGKTYSAPAISVPRLALWDPYLLLTRMYSSNNQQEKVIETAWKVLMSLGFTIKRQNPLSLMSPFVVEQWGLMEDYLIHVWLHLWTAYAQVAPELCMKAEEYAKLTYKICIGEDDTFDESYGKLAHQAIFEGLDLDTALQSMAL